MLERMRQAKMSFDMWGALSPLTAKAPPGSDEQTPDLSADDKTDPLSEKRTMSQAELESTLYKVCHIKFHFNNISRAIQILIGLFFFNDVVLISVR